jgi:hypothetical protein
MKKFKFLAPLGAALLLSSCSPFVSHWSATIFVHSNTSHHAMMDFAEFEGLMVFNLSAEAEDHSVLKYSLTLDEGAFNISYAYSKEEIYELKKIGAGVKIEDFVEALPKLGDVYLLVESVGKAKHGSFEFDLVDQSALLISFGK